MSVKPIIYRKEDCLPATTSSSVVDEPAFEDNIMYEQMRTSLANALTRVSVLEEVLRDMPCFWVWYGKRRGNVTQMVECQHAGDEDGELPGHAWCPLCKARAALSSSKPTPIDG